MTKWKIIVFETETGERLPVIFPERLTHKHLGNEIEVRAEYLGLDEKELGASVDIANRLTCNDNGTSWRRLKPVSAGFIKGLSVESLFGESETLNLKVNPEDLKLLNK